MVATADPCPRPVIFDLFDADYWHYGWLTVVINLSDLAAMGAEPAGMLISTVMPNDMLVDDYARFWDGVVAASDEWNCKILGGNIKDGATFAADGMAMGWCAGRQLMRRIGSSAGDLVYVVGDSGNFWSAVLHGTKVPHLQLTSEEATLANRALTRPQPRIREGQLLANSGLVTSCMDASDGVLGSLIELGRQNALDVYLDESALSPNSLVEKVSSEAGISLLKVILSWGDWQLVVSIREESKEAFEALMADAGISGTCLGKVLQGTGRVLKNDAGTLRVLADLSSERFSQTLLLYRRYSRLY